MARARLLRQAEVPAQTRAALRAEAVAELGLGTIADVDLHRPPGTFPVADFLAVQADREDAANRPAAELGDVPERHGHAVRRALARITGYKPDVEVAVVRVADPASVV